MSKDPKQLVVVPKKPMEHAVRVELPEVEAARSRVRAHVLSAIGLCELREHSVLGRVSTLDAALEVVLEIMFKEWLYTEVLERVRVKCLEHLRTLNPKLDLDGWFADRLAESDANRQCEDLEDLDGLFGLEECRNEPTARISRGARVVFEFVARTAEKENCKTLDELLQLTQGYKLYRETPDEKSLDYAVRLACQLLYVPEKALALKVLSQRGNRGKVAEELVAYVSKGSHAIKETHAGEKSQEA